jgi:hypothetical protein
MEIKPHLSEAELAEFVSDSSRGLGTHLESCDSCLREVAHFREATAALKLVTDQPQEFWDHQRLTIRTRLAHVPVQATFGIHRLAWVPMFAAVVLAALLVSGGTPAPKSAQSQTAKDHDHELLVELEQVMQSNGPEALAPASYFVQEIRQETTRNSRPTSNKEIQHEN